MNTIVDQFGRPFASVTSAPAVWRGDGYLSAVGGGRFGASSVVNRSTGFGVPGLDGGAANQAITKLRTDAELTSGIVEELYGVVNDYGRQQGYTLVLESSSGLLYADKALDITDAIVKIHNSGAKGSKPAGAPTGAAPKE